MAGRRLFAVSDLHVRQAQNRTFVEQHLGTNGDYSRDWLILGGDLGESASDLRFVFETVRSRFEKLLWVPGNHELWTIEADGGLRGEARYQSLVETCREFGVLTPEDPYPTWPDSTPEEPLVIAPMFLLYDYSFRPDDIPLDRAIAWAGEHGIMCTDEYHLHPDPHPSRIAWCEARVRATEERLTKEIPAEASTILVNHFPLRREHARLPLVPRFSIWCGTRQTENWHQRFRAKAVVFGHLHIRQKRVVDDVTFHEVSLGYRRQWDPEHPERYVHQIWPPSPKTS